jgi:rubrerythrin
MEPVYRVEDNECPRKCPKEGYHWFVPQSRAARNHLMRSLEERLDQLERNEPVSRTSRSSTWHCRMCRANMTRGHLYYLRESIKEEQENKEQQTSQVVWLDEQEIVFLRKLHNILPNE